MLTRDRGWWASGVIVVHSVEQALTQAGANELVAIGGAQIYRLLMPFARRIYLTHVHADVPGDTFFPDFDPTQWDEDVECRHPSGGRGARLSRHVRDPRAPQRPRGAASSLKTPSHPFRHVHLRLPRHQRPGARGAFLRRGARRTGSPALRGVRGVADGGLAWLGYV